MAKHNTKFANYYFDNYYFDNFKLKENMNIALFLSQM